MTKIAFIGAGSIGFTRGLVRDLLTFPLLQDATIALMDINAERLEFARKSVQRIIDLGKYPARLKPRWTGQKRWQAQMLYGHHSGRRNRCLAA
jgi:alpha-galactosidase/6-phospho-beta-glucosidase family protein